MSDRLLRPTFAWAESLTPKPLGSPTSDAVENFWFGSQGADVNVNLTGVSATGAVGSIVVAISIAITGVSATPAVGSVGTEQGKDAALTSVSATGSVGSVVQDHTNPASGVSATPAVGSVTKNLGLGVPGNAAASSVGDAVQSHANLVSGVSGTGACQSPIAGHGSSVAGHQAASAVGSVGTQQQFFIAITGHQIQASVGSMIIALPPAATIYGGEGAQDVADGGVVQPATVKDSEPEVFTGGVMPAVVISGGVAPSGKVSS